ncbi:thioesterase II family protein [Streptomyces capitiformicae]|uniref:Thioesterase n=1 Tax=Streptomyces capitiformicae TaxID=2014920 RepID=A0A918Z2T9_9ACTN|nr:alpha/beta fold hydrolase [Streptomyces capitiformicae]GHE34645.1 thioesterase [Streptomyces capitiformicae]
MTDPAELFVVPLARPHASRRLVCLPHAGSGASYYRRWGRLLDDSIELWVVQYPGRENRFDEPMITSMDVLAAEVADGVAHSEMPGRSTALFGHSMGAAAAYEAARILEGRGADLAHVFVSGCPAPGTAPAESARLMSDAEIIAEGERHGGVAKEVFDDPDLRALLLPVLRNDYFLVDSYRSPDRPLLRADVSALVADRDSWVSVDSVRGWRKHTRGTFDLTVLEGDHFFLRPREDEVIEVLHRGLGAAVPSSPRRH